MLKKNAGYAFCKEFRRLQEDVRRFLEEPSPSPLPHELCPLTTSGTKEVEGV